MKKETHSAKIKKGVNEMTRQEMGREVLAQLNGTTLAICEAEAKTKELAKKFVDMLIVDDAKRVLDALRQMNRIEEMVNDIYFTIYDITTPEPKE